MIETKETQPKQVNGANLKINSSSQENTHLNNPISRKLNKILESRVENDKVCIHHGAKFFMNFFL